MITELWIEAVKTTDAENILILKRIQNNRKMDVFEPVKGKQMKASKKLEFC